MVGELVGRKEDRGELSNRRGTTTNDSLFFSVLVMVEMSCEGGGGGYGNKTWGLCTVLSPLPLLFSASPAHCGKCDCFLLLLLPASLSSTP